MRFRVAVVAMVSIGLAVAGCSGGSDGLGPTTSLSPSTSVASANGDTPTLEILPVQDPELSEYFAKQTTVFGMQIVATADTPDEKIKHAAAVAAAYVDNDQDGKPDDLAIANSMASNRALLIMAPTPTSLENSGVFESDLLNQGISQDLYSSETDPGDGQFDAALEEVHHLILNSGWSRVYPAALGQRDGSQIAQAMDKARGGHFTSIPARYPATAWYTYDDASCNYVCMITEYTYWAATSLLGAQKSPDRCKAISQEWKLCTPAEVRQSDTQATSILTNPEYQLPTVLPTGRYTPAE